MNDADMTRSSTIESGVESGGRLGGRIDTSTETVRAVIKHEREIAGAIESKCAIAERDALQAQLDALTGDRPFITGAIHGYETAMTQIRESEVTNKDTLRAALEKAYLAGFRDSGEGYNGEHPEGASDKPDWAARRDKAFSIMGLDALAAKLGDGWQPIETAPKGGEG